ncbi:MAG: calcium/sodium antiporter [Burkholderiaceae bacterium]
MPAARERPSHPIDHRPPAMLVETLMFVAGLVLLVVGAELTVNGGSRVATTFGISPLVVGLTVVAFGTSAPETAVTVGAALDGRTDIALGNVVGSNIFNILLILGLSAVIAPLHVNRQLIRQEVPLMIAVSVLLAGLLLDGGLARIEAAVLFLLLIAYTVFLVVQARRGQRRGEAEASDTGDPLAGSWLDRVPAPILIVLGIAGLALGGQWLVDSASAFARALGVSELVIGLTVVAIGTSLPEVAASLMAIIRGQRDMAVGNIVGSNIFNVLCCLGLAGMVSSTGLPAPSALMRFDIWVMVATAACCLPIIVSGRRVSRGEGALLLTYCVAYILYTLMAATHHDALPAFSYVMAVFVVPLSALVLLANVLQGRR